MKKLIALLSVAAIMLSFTACFGNKNETNTPDPSSPSAQATNEDSNKKVARGTISGDVYTNEFAGITFTKTADWNFLSDDEIASTINAGQADLDLNVIEEALAKKASIYDMAAMSTMGQSVMTVYENTMLTAFKKLTADEYIDALKTQLSNVSGISYTIGDVTDATLGSTQFKKLTVKAVTNDVELIQVYYTRAVGAYIVGVVVTAFSDSEITEIEAMFS